MGVSGKKVGALNLGSSEFPLSTKSPGFPIRDHLLARMNTKEQEQPAEDLKVIQPAKSRRKVEISITVVMAQSGELKQILLDVEDCCDKANRSRSLREVENKINNIKTPTKKSFDKNTTPKKSSFRKVTIPYGEGSLSKSPTVKGHRNLELKKLVIPSLRKKNSFGVIQEIARPEDEESPNQRSRDSGTTPPPKIIILQRLSASPHRTQKILDDPDTLVSNSGHFPNDILSTQNLPYPHQTRPQNQNQPLSLSKKLTHLICPKKFLTSLFTRPLLPGPPPLLQPPNPSHIPRNLRPRLCHWR